MSVCRTRAVALWGIEGVMVEVEAAVSSGLPGVSLIGLPDRALTESIDRVRSAVTHTGLALPQRKITVNLSPADLPKSGSSFDLAIAMACLAAGGLVSPGSIADVVHLGELGLDGRLRHTAGILPAVLGAFRAGFRRVMVPLQHREEAQLVAGMEVIGVGSLAEAAQWHGASGVLKRPAEPSAPRSGESAGNIPLGMDVEPPDLSDVLGHADIVKALIAAAAGGHHMLMLGPPGSGKTMLARRLVGILPPLTDAEAIYVASISSLTLGQALVSLPRTPPFVAPHHNISTVAMVGGGAQVRPGALVQASHGVLFLDEAPEFPMSALDALRQPLEEGSVTITRTRHTVTYPARFQLVMAANPCPCGNFGVGDLECTCPANQRRRYLSRISGPLRDRIDIQVTVPRVSAFRATGPSQVTSAEARQQVVAARLRAASRWAGVPGAGYAQNALVPGKVLRSPDFRLPKQATQRIDAALQRGQITLRGCDRVLRLAWTLADLDEAPMPNRDHVGQALYLRRGFS